ncbi:MAG: 6-methylsalicylate decarboxylase [Acetobacteraceae bacterium]|jgi:predicted TIM-barrel fold metal-dependent hydrolase|nr:6-methylsalicylate decarboxylase [Acetobacteraceae bacterium]
MKMANACACCDVGILGRRGLLSGASALGAAGLLGATGLFGSARAEPAKPGGKPFRIDVHHHITPPTWLEAVRKAKLDNPPMVTWSPEKSLEDMDKGGVATAMTSPTTPQLGFLPAADAARIARESNEYARKVANDYPGRFGVFAMLPMPYVDESLKEIAYAFDTLHVDGIGMMTDYGDKWLGYSEFQPVFDELNRRKAVVYTHPTGANCCVNLVRGVPDVAVEYGADTTRTIVNLIFSGASQRYADIDFIFSHGGGVLTAVAERLQIQMVTTPPYKGKFTRAQVEHELNRFFYDTAQVANAVTIEALAKLVPPSQIVFGSDFPYRTSAEHVQGLSERFKGEMLRGIERDNAARILPGVAPV